MSDNYVAIYCFYAIRTYSFIKLYIFYLVYICNYMIYMWVHSTQPFYEKGSYTIIINTDLMLVYLENAWSLRNT